MVLRPLKHRWGPEACQVHSEDAEYGPLVVWLLGSFVFFSTSRVIGKGRLTMAEIIFSLKHSWRLVESEALEWHALSWEETEKAA